MAAAQMREGPAGTPRVAIFPETVLAGGDGHRRLPVALGDVQLCVLRAARVPMIRPAQAFLTVLQRRLEQAAPPSR